MLWIILAISIIVLIIGLVMNYNCNENGAWVSGISGSVALVMLITIMIMVCDNVSTKRVNNLKIEVLEQNNKELMTTIEPIIDRYLSYESSTYEKVADNSDPNVVVSLYPELRADTFIMSQLQIVVDNNTQIKKLKLEIASLAGYKPWLFFY